MGVLCRSLSCLANPPEARRSDAARALASDRPSACCRPRSMANRSSKLGNEARKELIVYKPFLGTKTRGGPSSGKMSVHKRNLSSEAGWKSNIK